MLATLKMPTLAGEDVDGQRSSASPQPSCRYGDLIEIGDDRIGLAAGLLITA